MNVERRAGLLGVVVGLALAAVPTGAERHPIGSPPVVVSAHVR